MQAIESIALGIRLLGIFLFVMLLKDMPQIIESINLYKSVSQGTGNLMYIYLGISIAAIFLSLIMIKFPISVSKLLYAKSIHASPQLSSDLEIAKVTGITILGVYILSWAIPDLVNNIIGLVQANTYAAYDEANIAYIWNSLITTILEIIIGLYCAINSNGIVKLISRLRA
tara:strand:+ start:73 stop:585 length:513 start_codon:yes stop_codon:yes gene_type:complete